MSKTIQLLPKQTANVGSIQTINWQSIECYIDTKRLLFLWRILLLPMSSIYKVVMITRLLYCFRNILDSPIGLLYNTCIKYGLNDFVYNSVIAGSYVSLREWKVIVKERVVSLDKRIFHVRSKMFETLEMAVKCVNPYPSQLWVHCFYYPQDTKKCICIKKMFLQVGRVYRHSCKLCNCKISTTHMLFECKHLLFFL